MILSEAKSYKNIIKSHPLFGLSIKLPKIESVKGFLGFINVILNDNGFFIKNVKIDTTIKIDNKRTKIKINYYIITFINEINIFLTP